jgi:hypothetical protein
VLYTTHRSRGLPSTPCGEDCTRHPGLRRTR